MWKSCRRIQTKKITLLSRYVSNYSTKPVPKEKTKFDDQLKEFQRISNIQRKIRTKKPQKPPFVKNLFLGVFDTDLLTYPEITNEELNNLNKSLTQAETFLQNPEIKECSQYSKDFLHKLASNKLLGLQASQLMGGLELNATEMCRFTESIAEMKMKNDVINNEMLGIQILIKFGSDSLKRKYLQKLIDGDNVSAFCIVEPLETNLDVFKKTAVKAPDGKSWVLNGQKNLILNGSKADIFFVVASTNYVIKDDVREQKYTLFLVERDAGGITSSRYDTVDGNLELSEILFENTQIPYENIIGNEEEAENILSAVYPEYRLSTGPICSVLNKNLLNKATEHFIKISKEPNLLYETDAVRVKLGEIATSLYAIDSMIYLTSGLIDNYDNQDTELETAIVKVFASEQAFNNTSSCLELLGPEVSLANHWCVQLHKEAICQVTLNDSNDNLKILIALFGLRHAGQHINELVKKLRNPLFYSAFILKRMWTQRRQADDNPKLNLYLDQYLHPSCLNSAQRLEYCVLRLQYATEILLTRYGIDIVNKHADLRRIAECIIDIYSMIACVGRASRSYCIGLQHADYEMTLATSFTVNALDRVKSKLTKIIEGPYQTNDENYRQISKRLFDLKKYYPVHPLTRNF